MQRNRLTIVSLALAAALAVLLFREALVYMVGRWGGDDYTHCAVMPAVIAYLVWERRKAFAARPAAVSAWGLAPLAAGLGLYWLGELAGEYFTLYTGFFLVTAGILLLHVGWPRFRTLLFPVALIPTLFPLPNFLNNKLTFQLQLASSALGVQLLQLVGMPALREGNIIDLGFTQLQVVQACSGLRFVFPLAILGVLLASWMKGAFWKKVVLTASTLPLAVGLNGFRIAATGILYQHLGPAVAEGFFHDFSGWLVFMAALGILLAETAVLNRMGRRPPDAEDSAPELPRETPAASKHARAWVAPAAALLLLGTSLAVSHGVDFRREVPRAKSLQAFPGKLGAWVGHSYRLEPKILDELDLTDYAALTYRREGKVEPPVDFYVAYYASQRKGESIHFPETCLPGSGWAMKSTGLSTFTFSHSPVRRITAQRVVMKKLNQTMVGYFWFDLAGRIAVNAYQVKLYNFLNALTQRRTDGALVRVLTAVAPSETVEAADARLRAFIAEALPALEEYLGRGKNLSQSAQRPQRRDP